LFEILYLKNIKFYSKKKVKRDLNEYKRNISQISDCMPGSYAYNGTCIYFSTTNQKLSWIQAERFCKSLPLNTSFLIIQNEHQYEFIRRKLIKLKEKENPIDNLMFYIGFKKEKSLKIFYFHKLFIIKMIFLIKAWKWTNNKSIDDKKIFNARIGKCGSLILEEDSLDLRLMSSSCSNTNSRFACEYSKFKK
jgi:hypothetical protein